MNELDFLVDVADMLFGRPGARVKVSLPFTGPDQMTKDEARAFMLNSLQQLFYNAPPEMVLAAIRALLDEHEFVLMVDDVPVPVEKFQVVPKEAPIEREPLANQLDTPLPDLHEQARAVLVGQLRDKGWTVTETKTKIRLSKPGARKAAELFTLGDVLAELNQ